jgi:hypothetical protein
MSFVKMVRGESAGRCKGKVRIVIILSLFGRWDQKG